MATGTRSDNTMSEGLRKLLGDIADMKLAPDADLPFLINLETTVLSQLKGGAQQALQTGQSPGPMGPGPSPMGPVGGMAAMSAPPPGMGTPPGTPGLMQGPNLPNPDELRRVLMRSNTANRLAHVSNAITNSTQ